MLPSTATATLPRRDLQQCGQYLQEQNPAPAYTDISEIIVPAATDDTTAEENTETPAA